MAPPAVGSPIPSRIRFGAAAIAGRGSIVLTGVIISILLPLTLEPAAVGRYFLSQVVVAGFSVFCQLGLTFAAPTVITTAHALGDRGRVRQAARQIWMTSLIVGGMGGAILWASGLLLAHFIPDARAWTPLLPILAASVPLSAAAGVLIECVRAIHAVRLSMLMMMSSGWIISLTLAIAFATHTRMGVEDVLAVALLGSSVTVLLGIVGLWRVVGRFREAPISPGTWQTIVTDTFPNWGTNLTLFVLGQSDLLLLSAFASLEAVAWYGIATRVSALLITPLAIANTGIAPVAVQLWTEGRRAKLQELLSRIALIVTSTTVALYGGFALFGFPLIARWNEHYTLSYWLALVLGFGQVVHAMGGSSGVILLVLGDQRMAFQYTLANGLLTIILCSLGLFSAGPFGLACGAAFCNGLQAFIFTVRMRRRYGVDASVMSLRRWVAQ